MAERLLLLPGILMPAALRFQPLLAELGADVSPIAKELEVYAGPTIPADYGIETELAGIDRVADDADWDRFHLFGHSAGGAIALAYVASRPDRVRSLAIDEPASDFTTASREAVLEDLRALEAAAPESAIRSFARRQLRDAAPDPEMADPPPRWMHDRPVGVRAFASALARHLVDPQRFRDFRGPVTYSYGSLSAERWEAMADRMATLFHDVRVERSEGLDHIRTTHLVDPARAAASLRALWMRAR